jgi:autotransporter-associated beta strand protein
MKRHPRLKAQGLGLPLTRWRALGVLGFYLVILFSAPAQAQTFSTAGGTLLWNSTANWTPPSVPNAAGAAVVFNSAPGNTSATLSGISPTVGSLLFNVTNTANIAIAAGSPGGTLVFEETNGGPAFITTTNTGTANNTISAPMTLADNVVATVYQTTASSAAGSLNLTATINGSGGFTKAGDGLATFGTGAKTYTGPTVLAGGRLRTSSAAAPTATSSLTINGGQLDIISSATFTFGSGSIYLNGSGPSSGPFSVFPGAIRNERGLIVTINNSVVLQSDSLVHVQANVGTGATANPVGITTFTGSISGPGKFIVTAPNSDLEIGWVMLAASNSYSGGTLVNGGILCVTNAAATLGTGDVTIDNSASTSSIARLFIRSGVLNAISDTATLSLAGGGTVDVADQGFVELGTGINELVGGLRLSGVAQSPGTYGSSMSSATHTNDEYFAGTGIITVLPPPPPTLAIARAGDNVILSWPTNATGYHVQRSPSLIAPISWQSNTAPTVPMGTNYTLTEAATNSAAFYRLKN